MNIYCYSVFFLPFKVDNVQSSAKKITAEMSEQSNLIKSFIVRTEDSRIIEDMLVLFNYLLFSFV